MRLNLNELNEIEIQHDESIIANIDALQYHIELIHSALGKCEQEQDKLTFKSIQTFEPYFVLLIQFANAFKRIYRRDLLSEENLNKLQKPEDPINNELIRLLLSTSLFSSVASKSEKVFNPDLQINGLDNSKQRQFLFYI